MQEEVEVGKTNRVGKNRSTHARTQKIHVYQFFVVFIVLDLI